MYSSLASYLGHLKMKKPHRVRGSSLLHNELPKLSKAQWQTHPVKRKSSADWKRLVVFLQSFIFCSSISHKYANKCLEIILIEDFKDIANLLHIKTSHNWLYQLVKVSGSDFFCWHSSTNKQKMSCLLCRVYLSRNSKLSSRTIRSKM